MKCPHNSQNKCVCVCVWCDREVCSACGREDIPVHMGHGYMYRCSSYSELGFKDGLGITSGKWPAKRQVGVLPTGKH